MPVFNCLVLSGGGAKGAYGAGAAKAIFGYEKIRHNQHGDPLSKFCYVGTSAGALNACILASLGPDRLIDFWNEATRSKVLGRFASRRPKIQFAKTFVNPMDYARLGRRFATNRSPFALYSANALRAFIKARTCVIDFQALQATSHLVICATNYTTGKLEAFYVSSLIDGYKVLDQQLGLAQQRLSHFSRIESLDALNEVLLASTAIPVAFPPVNINGHWYIDGGVGNNTPTREAAYICRYLNSHPLDDLTVGRVYCVTQDPPGNVAARHRFGLLDILERTYNVLDYIQMRPIINAWQRINHEVADVTAKVGTLIGDVENMNIDEDVKQNLKARILADFGKQGGATARLDVPLYPIEPGNPLGHTLDFRKTKQRIRITQGYNDTLSMFLHKNLITNAEREFLVAQTVNPVGFPAPAELMQAIAAADLEQQE